jgi:hypothetical protein
MRAWLTQEFTLISAMFAKSNEVAFDGSGTKHGFCDPRIDRVDCREAGRFVTPWIADRLRRRLAGNRWRKYSCSAGRVADPSTGMTVVTAFDDAARFRRPSSVEAYLGSTP